MANSTLTPSATQIQSLIQAQRNFFYTGATRSLEARSQQLKSLLTQIKAYEAKILTALKTDFGKSAFEGYATEIGFILDEIRHTLKYLPEWMSPEKVKTPSAHQPAKSLIYPDPYGVALIIAPWNYPFQLTMAPLVGAIAAGNCAILKPSEFTPATSQVMAELIAEAFSPEWVTVVQGDVTVNQALLAEHFDYIFFTGSPQVGKIVMRQAAEHLTPVTLELGGKSPCIVDSEVDLAVAARRIIWGKHLNAGQSCVAPDYVLVPEAQKSGLVYFMKKTLQEFYGDNPETSPDFARIINPHHFARLSAYLNNGEIVVGGQTNPDTCYIAPTILDNIQWDDPIMQEEIFGPILPILTYQSLDEIIPRINNRPRPLALYFFSNNLAKQERVLNSISFGGGCINDTMIHCGNPYLPFGGIGSSGIGACHGKFSFDTFTHRKGIIKRGLNLDVKLRYPPYTGFKDAVLHQVMK